MADDFSLVPAWQQPDFFPECAGFELLDSVEVQRGRFTAERVAKNEERYRSIVEAIGAGVPVRTICAAFKVSHHVVKLIREREPDLIATEKQRMSRLLGHVGRLCWETFAEDLMNGKVPAQCKPVAGAIALDKKAGLDGEATVRIEHVKGGAPSLDEVLRELRSLPDATVRTLPSTRPEPAGLLSEVQSEVSSGEHQ